MINCLLCLFVLGAHVHPSHGSIFQTPKHTPACRSGFTYKQINKETNTLNPCSVMHIDLKKQAGVAMMAQPIQVDLDF